MNPDDPEQYIRDLERGGGQTPPSAPSGAMNPVWRLVIAVFGTIIVANAVYWGVYYLRGGSHHSVITVHGNLEMNDVGAKYTIACNDGNLRLNGDNNTYTVTGHCLRLDVFGHANRVTVDSADSISASGDDNVMTYHSGSPTVNKTGNNNTVSQG